MKKKKIKEGEEEREPKKERMASCVMPMMRRTALSSMPIS